MNPLKRLQPYMGTCRPFMPASLALCALSSLLEMVPSSGRLFANCSALRNACNQ